MIQFTLSEEQTNKAAEFIQAYQDRQQKKGEPLKSYTYLITPTGLVNIIKIRMADGEQLDLTNWDF